MVARQNDKCSSPNDWPAAGGPSPTVWNRRTSQLTPTLLVTNATAPTPTSNAGLTVDTSYTPSAVVFLTSISVAPPTTYGRRKYSVKRLGAASTTLPLNVATWLTYTRFLSPA